MDSTNACPCESGLDYFLCCGSPAPGAVDAPPMATLGDNGLQGVFATPAPPITAAAEALAECPDLFLANANFNSGDALLLKMSPRWYRESTFLDFERALGSYTVKADLNWLADHTDNAPPQPASLIFHSAFCGSTLMTQALDATHDCLPLREPETLSQFNHYLRQGDGADGDQNEQWLDTVLRMHGRTYTPTERAVVKAKDDATELLVYLADQSCMVRALFMYTPLAEFLAACLRADSRRDWLRQRFDKLLEPASHYLSLPQGFTNTGQELGVMAALCWSLNVAQYLKASEKGGTWLTCLEFNAMLEDPPEAVSRAGAHLGLQPRADLDFVAALQPIMARYSKSQTVRYDASVRDTEIQQVLDDNPGQLALAEDWARQLLGADYPTNRMPGHLL